MIIASNIYFSKRSFSFLTKMYPSLLIYVTHRFLLQKLGNERRFKKDIFTQRLSCVFFMSGTIHSTLLGINISYIYYIRKQYKCWEQIETTIIRGRIIKIMSQLQVKTKSIKNI